jgi:polyhydroxyalkanoate synthesis regulator protein
MSPQVIVIKRYARARLYDPANRRYVTLDELRAWRESGVAFVVKDAETGADITAVLFA